MANAHLKRIDDKTVAVYVELKSGIVREVGRTKLESDAQFHVHTINEAIDETRKAAYDEGYDEGRNVGHADGYEEGRQDGVEEAG